MIENPLQYAKYFDEKTLFPTVKRILNFCFVLGVSSFLFEKFYFKYSLIDISDYKAEFEFIAKGRFFIPFSIFFLVWAITNFLGTGLFSIFNYVITEKFQKKIIDFSVKKNKDFKEFKDIELKIEEKSVVKPEKEWFVVIYETLKNSNTQKEYKKFKNDLEAYKLKVVSNSILILRALIAIFIYYAGINYFGSLLLIIVITTLLSFIFLLVFGYQFAELLPIVIQKVIQEIEKYIKEKYPTEE